MKSGKIHFYLFIIFVFACKKDDPVKDSGHLAYVRGTVYDNNGFPAENALVYFSNEEYSNLETNSNTTTDKNGVFVIVYGWGNKVNPSRPPDSTTFYLIAYKDTLIGQSSFKAGALKIGDSIISDIYTQHVSYLKLILKDSSETHGMCLNYFYAIDTKTSYCYDTPLNLFLDTTIIKKAYPNKKVRLYWNYSYDNNISKGDSSIISIGNSKDTTSINITY
jgi:hypothetical protein